MAHSRKVKRVIEAAAALLHQCQKFSTPHDTEMEELQNALDDAGVKTDRGRCQFTIDMFEEPQSARDSSSHP